MRMRKKKWADPYLQDHDDFCFSNPIDLKGKWKTLLNTKELHVEIGCGKGDYFNEMALAYPNTGWVAIEKDHSAAAVACKKSIEEYENLQNKRMIVNDASNLMDWFEEGEIDVIHLNFSDPWPKKYTHKRRLSSEKFLKMYYALLSKNGYIQMKTDNKDLFESSVLYFLENQFQITDISVDYRRNKHEEDAITEYERRFMDLNQPIYFLIAKPIKNK